MYKILIVEDDEILRDNLRSCLLTEGYHVLIAENGIKAYQIVLGNSPDLIISDIHMPYMDGIELMTTLHHENQTKYIPFIFITADIERPRMNEELSIGVKEYITKPFDLNELLQKIKRAISKNPVPELKIKIKK